MIIHWKLVCTTLPHVQTMGYFTVLWRKDWVRGKWRSFTLLFSLTIYLSITTSREQVSFYLSVYLSSSFLSLSISFALKIFLCLHFSLRLPDRSLKCHISNAFVISNLNHVFFFTSNVLDGAAPPLTLPCTNLRLEPEAAPPHKIRKEQEATVRTAVPALSLTR